MKTNKIVFFALVLLFMCKLSFLNAQESPQITVEDIWQKYLFHPDSPDEIIPMKDPDTYCVLEDKIAINKYEFKTGHKIETIVNASVLINPLTGKPFDALDRYAFSKDETKVLLSTEEKSVYRRSKEAWFWIYDRETKKIEPLFLEGKQRLAEFSPDGSMVAFVYKNNLYLKNLKTNELTQITTDGKDRSVINGTTDWVYEEELEITKGFAWSDDGNQIAFMRFDESQVREFSMTKWGKLYPEEHKYKYPKAGESNSVVDLYVYNLLQKKSKKMITGSEKDQYIPRFQWVPKKNELMVMTMNRLQNNYSLSIHSIEEETSRVIFSDSSKYWVNVPNAFIFKNSSQLITTSERDGFAHLYEIVFCDKKGKPIPSKIKQVTSGKWMVREIKAFNPQKDIIYYTSTESSSINSDLYSVKLDGSSKTNLSSKLGTWDAQFNADCSFYIGNFSDANTAPNYSVFDSKGKHIRTVVSNDRISKLTKEYHFQSKMFFTIKTSNNDELNAWMIKPENFDMNKKYPVLMYVYGGPGSQSVENQWGFFDYAWYQMLAKKGYIVVCVDNRGTGGKGEAFQKCTYLQLGKIETEDQIEGAKFLSKLPFVDPARIGIWGWSYGGYMTSLCITKGAEYFKTAISVAPVTNWRNYDNIYTERFMRTPQENADGYDKNSPLYYAKKLKGNYFIIHGSADDNVHYQNAMELVNQLIKENKQFNQFTYPNRNHFISGGNTRLHLYIMLTNYIIANL